MDNSTNQNVYNTAMQIVSSLIRMDIRTTEPYCLWQNKAEIWLPSFQENPREEEFKNLYSRRSGTLTWYGNLIYILPHWRQVWDTSPRMHKNLHNRHLWMDIIWILWLGLVLEQPVRWYQTNVSMMSRGITQGWKHTMLMDSNWEKEGFIKNHC